MDETAATYPPPSLDALVCLWKASAFLSSSPPSLSICVQPYPGTAPSLLYLQSSAPSSAPEPGWSHLGGLGMSHDPLSFGFFFIYPDFLIFREKCKGRLCLQRYSLAGGLW